MNATSILLEPLPHDASHELLVNLLGPAEIPPASSARITAAAEGNPLFVEELLRMLIDDGCSSTTTALVGARRPLGARDPGTINALLAARLDQLERGARGDPARLGRGQGLLVGRGAGCPRRTTARRRLAPPDARSQGARSTRTARVLGRARVPLPPPPDPRRGVPVDAEGSRAELHERFADWLRARRATDRRARGDTRLAPRAGAPTPRPSSGRSMTQGRALGERSLRSISPRRAAARWRTGTSRRP